MLSSIPDRLAEEALELLVQLVRFDTSNPPGNETAAARFLEKKFADAGLEPVVIEPEAGRGSVVVRLKAEDPAAGPLLLMSHLDVVPAEPDKWTHPPFAAVQDGGYLWGRGTLDMKHMAAMSAAVMIELKRSGRKLSRDLVFAAVADEEAGGSKGAAYLVEKHPDLIRADFALCEFGGFRMKAGKRTFIPVQVAQKGCAWCRAIFEGEPGHGSVPRPDTAVYRMARALARLEKRGLPLQVCEPARDFIRCIAAGQPPHLRAALLGLLNPVTSKVLTSRLPEHQAGFFNSILHPTAAPTVVRAGDKENVQPSRAEVMIDGRVLPGQTWEQFERQLRKVLGKHARLELLNWIDPVTFPIDTPLYDSICRVIARADDDAEPVPYIVSGFTDAAHLARLGTVTYGFTPLYNDPEEPFTKLVHGHDERISIEAFRKGTEMLHELVEDFCTTVRSAPVLDDLLEPVAERSAGGETPPSSAADASEGDGTQ